MPVTHLSKKEWTSIIHPAKAITLQRAKMSSSFPTDALYGSHRYQGLNFEDPYTKQGIEKIATLMQELSDQSQTGTLIKSVAEGFRLDLGFNATLATIPWNKAKQYVTHTWYSHLADFFADSNQGITGSDPKRIEIIDNIETMPYLRQNDFMLMQEFIKAGIPATQLEIISIMRLSIKATTLSDICTAEGRAITNQAWF